MKTILAVLALLLAGISAKSQVIFSSPSQLKNYGPVMDSSRPVFASVVMNNREILYGWYFNIDTANVRMPMIMYKDSCCAGWVQMTGNTAIPVNGLARKGDTFYVDNTVARVSSLDSFKSRVDASHLFDGGLATTSMLAGSIGPITVALAMKGDTAAIGAINRRLMADSIAKNTAIAGKQNSLGYTPYNATNPSGFISSVPAQTWASITGKPTFSAVATTGAYSDISGRPTIPTVPSNVSAFTNDAGYLTVTPAQTWNSITGKPTFATVATTGAYADLSGLPTIPSIAGLLSSSTAAATYQPIGSYLTTSTAASTYQPIGSYATSSQNALKLNSSDTTGKWLSPGSAALTYQPIGSYATVAQNALKFNIADTAGKWLNANTVIPSYAAPTFNNTPGRASNTAYRPSTTRPTLVSYTAVCTVALTLVISTGTAYIYLDVSPDNTTWTNINVAGLSESVTVAVALSRSQTFNVSGMVPANYYYRLRTAVSGSGTNSVALSTGQEVIIN